MNIQKNITFNGVVCIKAVSHWFRQTIYRCLSSQPPLPWPAIQFPLQYSWLVKVSGSKNVLIRYKELVKTKKIIYPRLCSTVPHHYFWHLVGLWIVICPQSNYIYYIYDASFISIRMSVYLFCLWVGGQFCVSHHYAGWW